MQTLLTELARIRLHGFSQREVLAAINISMADAESLYMERDQDYAQVSSHVWLALAGPFATICTKVQLNWVFIL
jgi:hypothetical protein